MTNKKSTRKRRYYYLLAALALILIGYGIARFVLPKPFTGTTLYCLQTTTDKNCSYFLREATTAAQREQGLSNREFLEKGTGMAFVFDQPAQQCMWMKDMRFPIDMMWLNDKKEIIKIEKAVTPETYPRTFCADNTKYVIELNSGAAEASDFVPGQQLLW